MKKLIRFYKSYAGFGMIFLWVLIPAWLAYSHLTPEKLTAISDIGLIPLTGEQEDEYPARDYVILETMRVSQGKTMKFTSGSRIFFHTDARIIVYGTLIFEGSALTPIKIGRCKVQLPGFSGSTRKKFDSTLIFVHRGAHLSMRHTVLEDPLVRVRFTDSTSTFELENVECSNNLFIFTDTAVFFPDSSKVTCSRTKASTRVECIPQYPDTTSNDINKPFIPISNPKFSLRIILGGGAVAAAVLWFAYNKKTENAYTAYQNAANSSDANRYLEQNHRMAIYRDFAAIGGGLCVIGVAFTFIIGKDNQ